MCTTAQWAVSLSLSLSLIFLYTPAHDRGLGGCVEQVWVLLYVVGVMGKVNVREREELSEANLKTFITAISTWPFVVTSLPKT